jgi:hypothetical protein
MDSTTIPLALTMPHTVPDDDPEQCDGDSLQQPRPKPHQLRPKTKTELDTLVDWVRGKIPTKPKSKSLTISAPHDSTLISPIDLAVKAMSKSSNPAWRTFKAAVTAQEKLKNELITPKPTYTPLPFKSPEQLLTQFNRKPDTKRRENLQH